jgi:hypothetical protein
MGIVIGALARARLSSNPHIFNENQMMMRTQAQPEVSHRTQGEERQMVNDENPSPPSHQAQGEERQFRTISIARDMAARIIQLAKTPTVARLFFVAGMLFGAYDLASDINSFVQIISLACCPDMYNDCGHGTDGGKVCQMYHFACKLPFSEAQCNNDAHHCDYCVTNIHESSWPFDDFTDQYSTLQVLAIVTFVSSITKESMKALVIMFALFFDGVFCASCYADSPFVILFWVLRPSLWEEIIRLAEDDALTGYQMILLNLLVEDLPSIATATYSLWLFGNYATFSILSLSGSGLMILLSILQIRRKEANR